MDFPIIYFVSIRFPNNLLCLHLISNDDFENLVTPFIRGLYLPVIQQLPWHTAPISYRSTQIFKDHLSTGQTIINNYFVRIQIVKYYLDLFSEGAKNILRGSTYLIKIGNVYIQYSVVVIISVSI